MSIRAILISCVLLSFSIGLIAEEAITGTAMGFHLGRMSASGYSMRFMGPKAGLQLTMGAYTIGRNDVRLGDTIQQDDVDSLITITKTGKEVVVNIGANYIHTLDDFGNGRLFLVAGGAYGYHQEDQFSKKYRRNSSTSYYYDAIPDSEEEKSVHRHNWTVGIGPGIELNLSPSFAK
ncbi:MAG: hypothetical protein Q8M98_01330 [Candidatus Cloacimonadaceae bacterium]|nr:hypothetical protein [Candidatus Cloacimonadaceae bacterium]